MDFRSILPNIEQTLQLWAAVFTFRAEAKCVRGSSFPHECKRGPNGEITPSGYKKQVGKHGGNK